MSAASMRRLVAIVAAMALGGALALFVFLVYLSTAPRTPLKKKKNHTQSTLSHSFDDTAGREHLIAILSRLSHSTNAIDNSIDINDVTAASRALSSSERREEQRLRILLESLNRELAQVDADIIRLSRLLDAPRLDLDAVPAATLTSNVSGPLHSIAAATATTISTSSVAVVTMAPTPDEELINLNRQLQIDALVADDARYLRLSREYEARLRDVSHSSAPARTVHVPVALEFDSSGVQRSARPPFIFAITSGRTGTKFFQQLLSTARRVQCFHELHPLMSHDYLRLPYWETYHERMSVKAAAIAGRISDVSWPVGTAYCDTSNYFIKSWWDVAIDRFAADYPFIVIVIRRRMADVLKSMVDLNWFGGIGRPCGKFLYTANSNISFVQSLAADEEMDHIDKALSHLFDVEAKAQFFKRRFGKHPNIRIHEVCLEQVTSSVDAAKRFLASLGLEPTPATDLVLSSSETNSRADKKQGAANNNITYVQHRIDEFVARYREQGVWLPTAPHIDAEFCSKPLP
jgi:hypothetical protein